MDNLKILTHEEIEIQRASIKAAGEIVLSQSERPFDELIDYLIAFLRDKANEEITKTHSVAYNLRKLAQEEIAHKAVLISGNLLKSI